MEKKEIIESNVFYLFFMADLQDMSKMILRTNGPSQLPEGYKLSMYISQTTSESVRIFRPRTNVQKDNVWSKCRHKHLQINTIMF